MRRSAHSSAMQPKHLTLRSSLAPRIKIKSGYRPTFEVHWFRHRTFNDQTPYCVQVRTSGFLASLQYYWLTILFSRFNFLVPHFLLSELGERERRPIYVSLLEQKAWLRSTLRRGSRSLYQDLDRLQLHLTCIRHNLNHIGCFFPRAD